MRIFAVSYHSMTASYGPSYIQASSPEEARRLFAVRGGFSRSEQGLIKVREVSGREVLAALREVEE